MEKVKGYFFLFLLFLFLVVGSREAEAKSFNNWTEIATEMNEHLDAAVKSYANDELPKAKEDINTAYFKYYEKLGFEKTVKTYISGRRVKNIEALFHSSKRLTNEKGNEKKLNETLATLKSGLLEDAAKLDESNGNGSSSSDTASNRSVVFLSSFGLTMREGLEAILIIGAIIAYLKKTNNKKLIKKVYIGSGLGVVFSIILAVIFSYTSRTLGDVIGGKSQEIFEGFTMFIAVAVLFYMSNWMLSKSSTRNWNKYVSEKVEVSVSKGSQGALVFSAFLAVAREGAELILFFQGIQVTAKGNRLYIWYGLAGAAVVLAVLFVLIIWYSVKIPLKPFFYGTSILMLLMCFSFLGKGVAELQEADLITQTSVSWMNNFSFEFLGINGSYEALLPQVLLVCLAIGIFIYYIKGGKKNEKV